MICCFCNRTNDIGYNSLLTQQEFSALVMDKRDMSYPKYPELVQKRFILPGNEFISTDYAASDLQRAKGYLRLPAFSPSCFYPHLFEKAFRTNAFHRKDEDVKTLNRCIGSSCLIVD